MRQFVIANSLKDQDQPKRRQSSYAPRLFSSSDVLVPYSQGTRTPRMTPSELNPYQYMALLLLGLSQLPVVELKENTTSTTTQKTTTSKTTTSKTTTRTSTSTKTTTNKMTTSSVGTATNSTSMSSTAVPPYSLANSLSFIIHMQKSNFTFTLLKQLQLDNGAVVDLKPIVENFWTWMRRICNFKYCYNVNQCGMTDMYSIYKPQQSGVPVFYTKLNYNGFFLGKQDYPIGVMQAMGNINVANSQCVFQHLNDAIRTAQRADGLTTAVVFTYIFVVLALFLAGCVAGCKIRNHRAQVRANNIEKATELTSLLPQPRATSAPVTASTDQVLEAQVAEIHEREQAEATSGCLQGLRRR